MADVTPTTQRLLGTLDRRFVSGALAAPGVSGADYGQAGPYPGVPEAQQRGLARVDASGEMASDLTVEIQTVQGGNPGGSRVAWRYSGDALWRGWDPPTGFSHFAFLDRSSTAGAWQDPHIASREDGYTWVAAQADQRYVKVWRRGAGASWTSATVYDAGSAVYTSDRACPCIVVLPNGRLLCLFWRVLGAAVGICASFSDDHGATWTTSQLVDEVLSVLASAPERIRAAYLNGQVLMLVHMTSSSDSVAQFASSDGGCSFTLVGIVGSMEHYGYWEVVASGGQFCVAALASAAPSSGATVVPYSWALASAFTLLSSITPVLACSDAGTTEWGTRGAGPGYLLSDGDLALCVDSFGVLRLYGRDVAAGNMIAEMSDDLGATWSSSSGPWIGGDASTHPAAITVCGQGGRVVMASTIAANPGTGDPSLCVYGMGGSSTVTMPQDWSGLATEARTGAYVTTWLPFDLPEDTGGTWTRVTGGAGAAAFTGLGLRVQGAAGADFVNWTAAAGATNVEGIIAEAEMRVTSGAGYLLAQISAAGPLTFSARIGVTATAIVLRDMAGAANVATVTTTDGASGVQVRIGLGDNVGGVGNIGKVYAWYRVAGLDADQEWILIGSTSTLVQGAAVTGALVTVGTFSAGATDVYFRSFALGEGPGADGDSWYLGVSNPSGMLGMVLSSTPAPMAETGILLAHRGGATILGDEWTIATAYEYPLSRIDPTLSPSPDAQWRSLADGVTQSIVYALTDAQSVTTPMYAVYLDGANFAAATWDGWDGAAWVTLGTFDLQLGSSLKYTRSGNTIRMDPSGGSACAAHIPRESLVGATWKTGVGGILRRIAHNTAGRWATTASAGLIQRPIITLETYDSGDAASGSAGAIYSPRGALVLRGQTTGYSRYRLQIASQDTAEGYYTLGTLAVMPLTSLGSHDYRSDGIRTNVDTVTSRAGVRRKTRLGRPARYAQVAWTDGIDTSNIHDTAPNYVLCYTGGEVLGTPAALAGDVVGLVAENDTVPVLYLPMVSVPATAASTMVVASDLLLYADIATDSLQVDVVVGDEHTGAGAGELVRVGSVRLDEVL